MLRHLFSKPFNLKRPKLKDFRNIHAGERCFVIGNGPSLTRMDLSLLNGEILFASNGIYHLFSKVKWRPSYYSCVDAVVLRDQKKEIIQMQEVDPEIRCFFPDKIPDAYISKKNIPVESFIPYKEGTCFFRQMLPQAGIGPDGLFPKKPEQSLVRPYTVTATLLQLAHLMGCSPIYLIGCDTYYQPQENTKEVQTSRIAGTKIFQADCNNDPNHFDPAYFGRGKQYQDPKVDKMVTHYEAIKHASSRLGFSIYNAGINSQLEVFPKVDYEQLFSKR